VVDSVKSKLGAPVWTHLYSAARIEYSSLNEHITVVVKKKKNTLKKGFRFVRKSGKHNWIFFSWISITFFSLITVITIVLPSFLLLMSLHP